MIGDLLKVPERAELIGGKIRTLMPTGYRPNVVAGEIFFRLKQHVLATRRGQAFTDSIEFAVSELRSERESFSPDASYYEGDIPERSMRFVEGPPTFAVEVRSENDYGPAAEAGLKKGDVIIAIAGKMIGNVEAYTALLAQQKAGVALEVRILRDNREMDLKVTPK